MFKITMANPAQASAFMDAAAYKAFLAGKK
jgi:hypothetical protein